MRDRIEAALGRWGRFVCDHAIWVVLATLFATALFATQLQYFRLDASMDSYFHEDDPIRIQYDAFRDIFGRDMFFVVALKPKGGVFQADFLDELRVIHDEIENEVPLLVEVTSLINVRETRGDEFGLTVEKLFSGEITTPPFSPSRLWRVSPAIFKERNYQGRSPFAYVTSEKEIRDYAELSPVDRSTVQMLMINAEKWLENRLENDDFKEFSNDRPHPIRPG